MTRISRERAVRGHISSIINYANRNLRHELNDGEYFKINTFSSSQGGIWTAYLMVFRNHGAAYLALKGLRASTEHKALASLLRACKRRVNLASR